MLIMLLKRSPGGYMSQEHKLFRSFFLRCLNFSQTIAKNKVALNSIASCGMFNVPGPFDSLDIPVTLQWDNYWCS